MKFSTRNITINHSFFLSTQFIMPSKINPLKKNKNVGGLASRAALSAAQKRGTVSAAAAADDDYLPSPAADGSPTAVTRVGRVLETLKSAASSAISNISPSRITHQTASLTIAPPPSAILVRQSNDRTSAAGSILPSSIGKSVASSESDISNRKYSSINEDNEDNSDDDDADDDGSKEGEDDGGNKQGDDGERNHIDNVDFEHLFEDDASIEKNDYAAQEYDFMDRMWHWLAPVSTINDKN